MMVKKEMIAMLLAGGRGRRLGILTAHTAKPAVPFGGKYRIIDFPLSNCVNSGVDTVGVVTQYLPQRLNAHVGIGIPWDLDRNTGGVSILPPYSQRTGSDWYAGRVNALFQNLTYMESYHPDYVLILPGDHVYKMDYSAILDQHKSRGADVTAAVRPAAGEEKARSTAVLTDVSGRICGCGPSDGRGSLDLMGIYIFNWEVLRQELLACRDERESSLERDILPHCLQQGRRVFASVFDGYWRDVDTLSSYWSANMELVDVVPDLNLYDDYWRIYTNTHSVAPQYLDRGARVESAVIGEGAEIYGRVVHSIIGTDVVIGKGAVVRDSIVMNGTVIGPHCRLDRAIVSERAAVGGGTILGDGPGVSNETRPEIYREDLVTVGEGSVIPPGVCVGRGTVIGGVTALQDYPQGRLSGGRTLLRGGDAR